MSANSLVQELRASGIELRLQDGRLVCDGPKAALSEESKRLIRARKAEIVKALVTLPIPTAPAASPWEHFLGLAGDEGLVGLYGAPVVGHFLLLLQRHLDAAQDQKAEAANLEREYRASIQRVEAARQVAVALGADAEGQHLRCELEVLHLRWEKGVKHWRSVAPEKALQAFGEIINRAAAVYEALEQHYPSLVEGIDLLPETDFETETDD